MVLNIITFKELRANQYYYPFRSPISNKQTIFLMFFTSLRLELSVLTFGIVDWKGEE